MKNKHILWWGRSDLGYSRNEIVIKSLKKLGYIIIPFFPKISCLGLEEALLKRIPRPDLVWVPCFRQRDFAVAQRFARRKKVPLVFDPLISSYDKRVFEFKKFAPESTKAKQLRTRERKMFSSADIVLADTEAHKEFFEQELGTSQKRCFVIPVGADQDIFKVQPFHAPNQPPEAFFYGSFLPLHGIETIIEAARVCPEIRWTLLGDGTLRNRCKQQANELLNLHIEAPIPYADLPSRIGKADVILGVFGTTPKAGRVIPNKVFQAMSCARPVITRISEAYPAETMNTDCGLSFIPPGNPEALATAVRDLLIPGTNLEEKNHLSRQTFEKNYSADQIILKLKKALATLDLTTEQRES